MQKLHKLPRLCKVDEELVQGFNIKLTKDEGNYLFRVLRKNAGDEIRVFNATSGEFIATILEGGNLQIGQQILPPAEDKFLGLIFSPIKNVDASFIVQKATELGVSDIYPVKFRRTIVDKVNLAKLMITAREAAEQCERLTVPNIHEMASFSKLDNNLFNNNNIIVALERDSDKRLKNFQLKHSNSIIIIGPEGGFAPEDIDIMPNSIYKINLGPRILRAETAIIAALSIYQELHDQNF